jgi:hypothetical protein
MELVRSCLSIHSGLPCEKVRSAPAIVFSGPAQRSLTLWPARSPSRHATLYTEGSDSFVASAAASIAAGWSEPVPGRELHPLKSSAFSRRTFSPTDDGVRLLRTPRTHRGAQIALVFGTPILTIEVDEDRSVGNGELGLENEDTVLCAVVCDFVDE